MFDTCQAARCAAGTATAGVTAGTHATTSNSGAIILDVDDIKRMKKQLLSL
jgi:hypothetical protein